MIPLLHRQGSRFRAFRLQETFCIEKFIYETELGLGWRIKNLTTIPGNRISPGICAQFAHAIAAELRYKLAIRLVDVYVYHRHPKDVRAATRPLEVTVRLGNERFFAEED